MALDFSRFGTPVEQAPVLDFSKFGTPVEAEKEEPPSRTFGEVAGDVGASLVKGLGQAAQFPGQLVGLVPGMRGVGEALASPGAALAEYGEGLKSAGLKTREALRNKALSEAEKEGFLAEFSTAIGQTIKDPALLSSFLLEQVPQLLGPAAAVKVTTMLGRKGVQAAAEGEARKAAETALRRRATAAAVGTGAAAQGASVGDETYKAVYDLAIKQGKSEEEARALAAEKARVAGAEAGVISVATSRLPGGSAIERRLAGLPGVPGAGRIGVGAREAVTEGLEEAGGAFAKGVGMAEVEPTISPLTGVGTAAGLGVVGGAGLGAIVGGQPTPETAPRPGAPGGEPLIERRAREAAEKAKLTPPEAAPEVPEPVVRKPVKPGELPETLPQVLDDATVRAIGFVPGKGKKKTFYDKLVGKDLSNPKDLETVRSMLTNFVEKKRHDGELKGTGLRAEAVLGKLPPAPAVTPTPAPPAPAPEAAAPAAEAPVVETPAPPPPAASAAGRTPASFAADIAAGKKLDSPEDVQFYQNNAAEIEAELKKIVTKPSTLSSTVEDSTKLLTRSSFKDPRDFWEYLKGLPIGALNGSEIEASGWMGEDLSGTVESEDNERLTVRRYDGTKALVDRVSINDVIPKTSTTPPPPVAEAPAAAPEVTPPTAEAAPAPAPEAPRVEPTEPEAGGAGAPVAGGPTTVTPTEGAGAVEPVRVVPAEPDAEQPAGGEKAKPVAVKQRAAKVSFRTSDSGIVFNESVSGALRRVDADDDIALEFPAREGAIMLTGIDRQAGGQRGRASDVLKALTAWADQNNERLVLMPSASGDLKQPELIKWYERNGFVQAADGAMERAPKVTPAAEPEYTEEDIDRAVDLGVLSEEEADAYRAELRGEEAPSTAMAAAFEERVAALKAQQDKLRQKNGKPPAPKSKNRAKYDELQAQIDALGVQKRGSGDLLKRLEAVGATGVFTVRGENPIVDFRALKDGLVKARAKPQMIEAVLAYVGFDNDGYLTRPMSRDEAAQSVGMKTSSGANVSEVAEKLGITAEVRSRFHASQTDKIGIAKNVSESSESQLTDVGPKRGLLYEPPTKKKPAKVVKFLSSALTPDGKLDFTNIPLESQKATKRAKAVTGLAEMYVRSSFYNMDRNSAALKQLRAEVDARIKRDTEQANAIKAQMNALRQDGKVPPAVREEYKALEAQLPQTAKTRDAINRAYGVFTAEQEAEVSEAELERTLSDIKKGDLTPVGELVDLTPEEVVEKIRNGEAFVAGDVIREQGAKDLERKEGKTRASRLEGEEKEQFGEEADDRYARGVEVESPDLNTEQVQALKDNDLAQAVALVSVDPTADRVHRAVAKRLAELLDATRVDLVDNLTDDKGRPILGRALVSGEAIQLDRDRGLTQEVLLHEGVHAAAERVLVADEKLLSPQQLAAKRELQRLFEAVQKDPDITSVDAKASLSEFVAEVMSNRQLQEQLGKKPWRMSDAMQQFKSMILRLLGVKDAKSMLTSAMASVDAIFTPTSTQIGAKPTGSRPAAAQGIAPETEKAVKGVNVIAEQAPALTPKGNPALKARIKFADSLAGLEDVFTAAYSGLVRTATGRLNPMVLLSRALDTQRVSRAVQKEGTLVTKEGLLMADKLVVDGREISYKDTLARIAETAKKEDKTYEQYRDTIDKVLYGHLEYNLREYNRNLDQQADALEAAGKTKDAKAMREDKITLAIDDDKQLDALEAAFQKDTFIQGISKDLDAIRFSMLDKLVEVGRISEDKAKEWKENTGYIPLQRITEYAKEYDEAGRGTNRGVVAMKNIRKREGSKRATTSPVENFSQFMDWAVGEAMKNEAGYRALTDLELLGSAKRQDDKPAFDSPGGMVTVYEKGVPTKFYVQDPGLFVGLSLQEKQLGSIAKAFQRFGTQPLRAGVTALPPFAVKQVFDDIVRAYTYAGVKNNAAVVKNILLNFPKNWYKEIFKVKDKGIQELENLGVIGTFDFTKQGNLKNILEEAGAKKEGLGSAIFRVMEAGAKASDLAVRQAIYQQVLKETGDVAQAESAAREIINFSRRGAAGTMQTLISVIPFFNAYAQGMDKLATAAAGRVVGTKLGVARSMFYKRMAVLTGLGLAYALLMSDDEDYQALPDHVRDTNWILPYGKYLGFTPAIPVPAELAFFFKAIPERVVQFYKHQGTDEERAALDVVKELLVRGVDVFSSPNLTPQLIRPFLENITNYSWFLGRPLESQAQLKQRPFMRAGTSTSDTMKVVAELLEDAANATGIEAIAISPIKLENTIRGLLGSSGGVVLALTDAVINPSRTDRPLHQQLKSQLTGASAVMKDAVGTRYLDKVYKLEADVEQVYNTYNRLLQDKPEKTAEFIEDNKGLYSIRPAVQGLMNAIRAQNAAARQIDKATDITPDERRKQIDELRVQQNDLAKQALMLRKMAMDIQLGK